jgi:patatin-like phospholipase/acyl hydrolase
MNILSIDGGGVRGIIAIIILQDIEERMGVKILDTFDLFCGTSTGALITSGIVASNGFLKPKYDLNHLYDFYATKMGTVFPTKHRWFGSIKKLFGPEFDKTNSEIILKEHFGDAKLSQTIKPILIPTYDIANDNGVFLKSRKARLRVDDDIKIYDACIATVSAPTYFKPHTIRYDSKLCSFIDGGVFINNPAMAGIAEAMKHYRSRIKDIKLLSIGTGFTHRPVSHKKADGWGLVNWIRPVFRYSMIGNMRAVDYEVKQLLGNNRYVRFNFEMDKEYSNMSDSRDETIQYFIDKTNKFIKSDEYKRNIENFIERL